jgi:hypothetical protein
MVKNIPTDQWLVQQKLGARVLETRETYQFHLKVRLSREEIFDFLTITAQRYVDVFKDTAPDNMLPSSLRCIDIRSQISEWYGYDLYIHCRYQATSGASTPYTIKVTADESVQHEFFECRLNSWIQLILENNKAKTSLNDFCRMTFLNSSPHGLAIPKPDDDKMLEVTVVEYEKTLWKNHNG